MNNNLITIIQARMNSSRLHGKIMLPLIGKPLIHRMVERVQASKMVGKIIVATTDDKSDGELYEYCIENNINVFRGHSTDLLDRHYQAAIENKADVVLKIPSDCPLIDPAVIDKVVKYFLDTSDKFDYVSNLHPATYPDGNDVEVIPIKILKTAWEKTEKDYEREHTTPYIWERPDKFRIGNVEWETGKDYSMSHRFTIDYLEDYLFIKEVYEDLYEINKLFSLSDILELLSQKPEIQKINKEYVGVNWYRNHLDQLKTITPNQTKII